MNVLSVLKAIILAKIIPNAVLANMDVKFAMILIVALIALMAILIIITTVIITDQYVLDIVLPIIVQVARMDSMHLMELA